MNGFTFSKINNHKALIVDYKQETLIYSFSGKGQVS